MEPVVLVIGAQKAGTTALFSMLAKHTKAAPPSKKELDFFSRDDEFAQGLRHYRSQFPPIPAKSFGHFTFEASPSYLYQAARCAPRIAKALPHVLCVAILRDPVQRAFSAWNMRRDFIHHPHRRHLHDPRSFAQAVQDELAGRTKDETLLYLRRGMYTEQLAHYYKHFPKSRLKLYSYREFKSAPIHVVNDIVSQLGYAPFSSTDVVREVRAHVQPYTEQLDPALATDLYAYFRPEIQKLNELIGTDLDILEVHH
jgi:hypothetical protein